MARVSSTKSKAAAISNSHKRQASATNASPSTVKRAKRQAATQVTSKKARATQSEPSDSEAESESLDEEGSTFENGNATSPSPSEDEEIETSDDSEAAVTAPTRRKSKAQSKRQSAASSKDHGTKSRASKSAPSLNSGTRKIIRRPTARDPGDTPYLDETVHPNTMEFLRDLAANNDREWLNAHDPDYRASLKDWASFVESLTHKIIEYDETIPELPVKDLIFRIHRDVRFSNDKTPYKTAFSAAFSRTGRKGPYAVYYLQIKPNGGSLLAGGLWMPEAGPLSLLRRDIDRRPQRLKQVLCEAGLRKEFLDGVANDPKKVVKKFVEGNAESALKTKPKGFAPDHKDIALLRLRSFTVHRRLEDDEVVGRQALERIGRLVGCLVPFITYLNSVVMPDDESDEDEGNGDSGSGEEQSDSGE